MLPHIKMGEHVIGKKHLQAVRYWLPTVMGYGTAAVVALVWFIDVKSVMTKVPFYNTRFSYPYENDKLIYRNPTQT